MPANISYKGTDLDSIFETPRVGTAAANTNYQVAGVDISNRFTALAARSEAGGNAGARVPPTGILTSAGTDLANLYAGAPGQYSVTSLASITGAALTVGATVARTHSFTLTFASAAALTNYFTYGGRIQITAANTGTYSAGSANALLQTMLSSMGTLIIYQTGHYRTGAGGTVNNAATGGSNIGTTSTLLYTLTDGSPYGASTYTVTMVANAAAGSATTVTLTVLFSDAHNTQGDENVDGTLTSTVTLVQPSTTYLTNTWGTPTISSSITGS